MPTPIEDRREELAINFLDLEKIHPELHAKLQLSQRLDVDNLLKVEGGKSIALKFTCPLLTAAIICDIMRSQCKKAGEPIIRVYLKRSDAWTKLSDSAILTWCNHSQGMGEKATTTTFLSPLIFPPIVRPEDLVAPPVQVVKLGNIHA